VPTITGSGKPEIISVSFGGTSTITNCTTSPCFIDQIGTAVSSITRTGLGTYTMTTSKTYSKLKCTTLMNVAGVDYAVNPSNSQCSNCNSPTFSIYRPGISAYADGVGIINCIGTP
jgi:hypothetical protein